MNKLINEFELGLFLYQIALLLHFILFFISIYYVVKNKSKFKNPYLLIIFSFLFPFIVSVPLLFFLAKREKSLKAKTI